MEAVSLLEGYIVMSDGSKCLIHQMFDCEGEITLDHEDAFAIIVNVCPGTWLNICLPELDEWTWPEQIH